VRSANLHEDFTMRAAVTVIVLLCLTASVVHPPSAFSQEKKAEAPGVEYKAVALGTDEREATRKLNELAAQGWEYVGPLGNSLVAFRRARAKSAEPDLATRVTRLGGKMHGVPVGKGTLSWAIDFKGTKITDADVAALGSLENVGDLDLSFTQVTDRAISALAGCTELDRLTLTGTKVTDAAIAGLRKLPALRTVNLGATAVTAQGIARLVEDKSLAVCPAALGDQARFRVFQEFRIGELHYNYLMINDTYYGRYYVGPFVERPGGPVEDRRRLATTYYHRNGPVGAVLRKLEWFKPAGPLDYPSDVRLPASLVGMMAAPAPLPTGALANVWSEPALAVVRLKSPPMPRMADHSSKSTSTAAHRS
jgi:hypothetical protein